MATFKEIAEYILSLPETIQMQDACFCNPYDDMLVLLDDSNIRYVTVQDIDVDDNPIDEPYQTIMVADMEIDESYKHYVY